jgi:hypothetical protein
MPMNTTTKHQTSEEWAEAFAQRLLTCASLLGAIDADIRAAIDNYSAAVINEPESVDLLTGPESADIRHALRSLAMRLDRSALAKSSEV